MIDDTYKTIAKPTEGAFKDRGSKFLAFAYPVKNEDEITEIQKVLRKKFYDARHQAYAFRLGADKNNFRASDDGEPTNSSGQPILGQIRSFDLTNILIIVVRYFGGTKLGIPGLINAYKTAALDAINNAEIITKTVNDNILLDFEYVLMNDVMKIIKDEDIEIENQQFDLNCHIELSIRKSKSQKVAERFEKIRGIILLVKGAG